MATEAAFRLTSAETTTLGFRTGLIHIQGAPVQFGAVQGVNRILCFRAIRHFDKPETARLASHPIRKYTNALDSAIRRESAKNLILSGLETKVSDK
jgi:hypothetical protein